MLQHPQLRPVATLAVGTVVFGGTVGVLAHSGPADPRVALAGLLAAAALSVALLTMIWARRRADSGSAAPRARRQGSEPASGTSPSRLAMVDLGRGRAAVIFDEPVPDPEPRRRPNPLSALSTAHEAAATADAICKAVADAVEAAGTGATPDVRTRPPRIPVTTLWTRLRSGRGTRRGGAPDSR